MTLPPSDTWQLEGVDAPLRKVGPICANPFCSNNLKGGRALTQHAHHMWRRSRHGKKFNWIRLPDGTVVSNLVGLCVVCHDDVTGRIGGHRAAIRVYGESGVPVFLWCRVTEWVNGRIEYEPVGPIDPQPSTLDSPVASPAEPGSDSCPTCGQRRARKTPARSRARKTWPVRVPADAEENGAEVLDSLTEDLAPLLGVEPDDNGSYTSGRYWVLVPALYFAQQQRELFKESILGKGA